MNEPDDRQNKRVRERAAQALKTGDFDLAERMLVSGEVDLARLTETLRTYQVELETQNAELRESQLTSWKLQGCYSALFHGLPLAALVVDPAGIILDANQRAVEQFGLSTQQMRGQLLRRLFHVQGLDQVNRTLQEAGREGEAVLRDIELRHQEGRVFPGDLHVHRLPGREGRESDFACVLVDLSVHKDAEARLEAALQALGASERRYRIAADYSPDWDYWYGADGTLKYVSPGCETVSGYTRQDFLKDRDLLKRIMPPEDAARWQSHMDEIAADGASLPRHQMEFRIHHRNGEERWIEHECLPVVGEGGEYLGRRAVNRDITRRKRAEQALRDREQQDLLFTQSIIDSLRSSICVLDYRGEIITVNRAWRDFARRNGGDDGHVAEGVNYLAICDRAIAEGEEGVRPIVEGIRGVLSGSRDAYEADYQMGDDYYILRVSSLQHETEHPRHVVVSHVDVSGIKRAETAMRQAKDEAEHANRAKSEFLSAMSHELRTPMNAILGFSQLLEADPSLSEEQKENLEEILKGGRHLLALINQVLDLAKVESGRMDLSPENLGLEEVVDECVHLVMPLADQRGIVVDMGEAAGRRMRADRVRLKQVLINLLSNAVKYNRDGGRVQLGYQLNEADATLRISVEDTGPGISEARQAQLFEPFNRLGADATGMEGTGIGLSLSRSMVQAMGGQIGVTSTPDEGSTFWIELPVADDDILEISSAHPLLSAPDPKSGATDQVSRTVLYVDDNPSNLHLVEQILKRRRRSIRIISAHTSGTGLELARAQKPDLILMDINMPHMDGFEVLNCLKQHPETSGIPVLALTAYASERDSAKLSEAGFQGHLTKPLDMEGFLAEMDTWLE
ncbi:MULTISPECIES: PAS domain S-box protein [unclassified Ectothiorhodospira]|uniref:hybrid sensor histidine kinase/response regulator n=1 Tax=unclassified Ectothiorhodospira TaxID=2684909 RepID=UPI001EE9397E|nr:MULTISPECIES: PAS domain S-box protein [unclassified Ectothiorhodospira]MCG5514524.1 PAS domain S-box protein [Ectothiorhodospira sp. 9100]MCG5518672.1 PAS domain S-box protein [Ectothiorhodospira sp. 9905]